jgi:hypothetical protein
MLHLMLYSVAVLLFNVVKLPKFPLFYAQVRGDVRI